MADEHSILWNSTIRWSQVRVNGELRDLTIYQLNRLVEGSDAIYEVIVTHSPEIGAPAYVWDEQRKMLEEFRVLNPAIETL